MKRRLILLTLLMIGLLLAGFWACGNDEDTDDSRDTFDDNDDDNNQPLEDDDDNSGNDDDSDDDNDDTQGDDDSDIDNSGPCRGEIETHQILWSQWDYLPDSSKQVFINTFGTVADGATFYARLVYWFGLTRELFRSAADYYQLDLPAFQLITPWEQEIELSRMAIIYYRARGETLNLFAIHSGLTRLQADLESPVPETSTPEEYFAAHQDQIYQNPDKYLWYLVYWGLEALTQTNTDEIQKWVAKWLCDQINTTVTLPLQQPHLSFDATLPAAVLTAFNNDLGTWELRVNPKLELVQKVNIRLVQFK